MRSPIHTLSTSPGKFPAPHSEKCNCCSGDRLQPILDTQIATTIRRPTPVDS
jgi:hypothetical protein